jgi:hypothetical protein
MRFKIFSIFIFITVLFSLAVLISIKTNQEVKVKVKYNIVEDDPSVSSRIISSYILGNDLIIEYSSDAEPRIEGLSSERYRIDDEKIVVYNYNNGYFRLVFGKGSDVYEFGIVPSVKAQEPQHNVFFDKPIDWSALWYLVKDHIKWDLEWSLDGSIWTSVTSDLTIKTSLIKQDTYKITLIFDASQAGNYRLTFAVDARVRNYVTRLDKYQYELDYEGFSLVFDWSDVVKISGLVITHGLKEVEGNEYFWFRMRRDGVPKGAHVEIDPTVAFTTVSVTSVHTCPLDTHTFVIAYHDETNDDFSFQIYDTNGTQVLAETDVDTTSGGGMDLTSIGVSAFNSTTFVIGWFDREVGKVTFSVYNSAGTLLSGPIDADTWVGYYSLSVSVSSFNSTAFVIGWYDGIDYDATFAVYNSAGTLLSGPIDADTDVGASSYSVSVSCFNSTAFVIGWYDSTDYDATFAVYNSAGTNLTMPIGADTTAGASYSVSVSTLNSTYFVIGWYDSTDQDATFAVYDSAGALKTGPTDADTAVGAESYSVQVSALNSTAFVISWYDYTDFDLSFATYLSDGTAVATLTDIESWPTAANSPFKYQSPCSQESGTGIKICNDNWIIAYANTTTQAGWRSYNPNGTVWDGICPGPDETAPTYSNIGSNVTNNTAVNTGTPINISAQWNDSVGLSMYVNSSKINNTGSWTNDTTWKTFTTGNWSNFTVIFPSAQGSNITVKIYANNTFGNQNVTGTWFWWNVTPDTTPPTYSQNSTNSTLAGTPVEHRLKWTDNVGLSGYIFSMNNTGTWQNDTWVDWTYVSDNFTDETKISAKNNVYVNTTAGHVRLADTVSGWVSPTGHEAGSGWSNEAYAYDDNLLSYTTIYMDPYGWTPFLNLTIDAITSNSLRYYAEAHPPAQGSIDVDVYKDGAWVDVYEGTLPYYIEWTEKTFTEGSVTKARVRIELGTLHSTADFGEFDFWDYPSNLYYSTGLLYSTNLLYGTSVSSIDQFNYTVSSLPAQTTLDILFSQDNSTWYNSTGGSDWQSLSSGTNTIDLSGLSWSGANFYYKAAFNNTDDSTPKLDYIAVLFTPSTTQWSNVTKTVNSTVGALVQWCVYANDTSNNWNGSSCTNPFSYLTTSAADTTSPTYSNNQTQLITIYTSSGYSNFSITWTDNSGSANAYLENNFTGALTNTSMSGSYPNFYYNTTPLAARTYQFRFIANDSSNNQNSTDVQYFTINKAVLIMSLSGSNVTYPTAVNIIPSETNTVDTDVNYTFWRNSTLVSSALGSAPTADTSSLGAGWYVYKLNSSGGTNFTSNATGVSRNINVSKATPTISISGDNVTYPTSVSITTSETNSIDTDCTYTLYRNTATIGTGTPSDSSTLGVDSYTYVYNTSGCTNFTSGTTNRLIVVSKGTLAGSVSGSNVIYPTSMNEVAVESNIGDGDVAYYLYRDGVQVSTATGSAPSADTSTLGVGSYSYILNATGTFANWTQNASIATDTTTVNKGALSGSLSTPTVTYPTSLTATASESNNGDSDVAYRIYCDEILVASATGSAPSGSYQFGAGNHNCKFNTTGAAFGNWTTNASIATSTGTVNQGGINIDLYFNTTKNSDKTITYPEAVNVTGWINISSQNTFYLYENGTSRGSQVSQVIEYLQRYGNNTYNFTIYYPATENYSSFSRTNYLKINKATPTISLVTNCTWSGTTYETVCNQTGYVTTGDATATKKLYRDGVEKASDTPASEIIRLGYGNYNYNYTYFASENYTFNNATNTLVINKKNVNVQVYPTTQTKTYPDTTVTQYCTDDSSLLDCSIYRNGTSITNNTQYSPGVGVYVYKANITDIANYTNYEDTETLTVNPTSATLTLYLNSSSSNITVERNWAVNITAVANNAQGTIYLYNNSVLITSCSAAVCTNIEPHPANVGTEFNITAHYPATQNYSSATSASYYIKINNTIPSVPNLLTPTNNDYTADNTTTFDWSDSNDPNTEQSITYDLQIFYNNGTQRLLKSSLSSSTYTLSSGEALPDGVYKWRVRAYDSVNYSAWTSNYTLTIDTINPDITMYIPSPLNTTIVNSSIALNISCFNTNLKDVILNITNSTNYLLHSNSTFGLGQPTYWWTHTVDTSSWNEGNMTITINCSDYANNQRVESYIFTVDHYVPSISGLTTYPTSPTTYSPGQNYQFNATITDTGSGLSQIIFEFNGANYTDASHSGNVYYKTLTDLTANPSGYSYRWYANDSANQWSSSSIQSYVINKASPSISVAPLTSVTYGTATQTGCQRDSGDSSSTLTLYRNNSQVASDTTSPINESSIVLAAGTYNYTCTISETQNYTFGYSLNNYRTVDKAALTGSISILPSTTVTYPTETTSSYSETNIGDSDVTYKFYRDDMEKSSPEAITLGAGAYTYKLNTTAGSFQNYTANSSITTQILTVNQNTSNPVNLYLNGTLNSNRTYTYPEVVNATGAAVYTNSGTINLYRDGVNKSNPEIITLGNGTYAYKVNATGNANYSDNSTGITFYALINKGTPDVKTFIDELPSNKAVTYPTSVTIRGNSTTSIIPPTFNLYVGSVSLGSGNPVSQSVTMGAGTHNVVYNTPGNANWTSASNNTLYLIVQQNNTNPIDIYIDNGTVYKNQNVTITYGTQITANSTLIYSSSGTALLWRNDSSTTNPETVLLGAGTYTYKGNTSGNENYTSNQTVYYYVFVNKAPTSTNLLLNGTDGDRTYNYGQVANLTATVNASGETVRIDANFTSGYTTSGTTPLHNYTTLNYNPGTYNVTGYMQETTNYTASSETHYLYLYGWSKIEWTLPTGSVNRSILNLICKVTDKNTTSTISNYPVKFYNSTHYLGQSLTNSSGYANLSWDSRGVDVGEEAIKCNITDNSTLYYNASETYEASTTLTLMGTLNVTITSPTDGSNYYRGQTVSLQSDIKDENGVTIAGTTANWYNTTTNIYSGEDGTWTIPLSDSLLGSETILANATKTYYNNGESSVTITILNNLPIATTPAYNVTPAKIVRGEGIRITCNVTDTEDSAGQLSVNISIKNPNNVWNNITASNIGDTFYRDYQTTESSALGTYIAVCSALDTDSGRIENSSTFLVWQNATITIDLNASEYSWGVGVNVFGQASYTDAEYVSSSDTTVKVEGQTKCTTTTDSSGQYSCAFSAPESIGNFTLFVEITDVRTGKLLSNSTVLIVRTTYGEAATERTGAENVVCYEVPQIVQNPDGTIKRATVKLCVWK